MARQAAISLPPEVVEAVERWRLAQTVPPSKSAAMAAMIAEGLRVFEERDKAGVGGQPKLPFGGS
jgi:hypothetical protein